jgi:hypothetical protein
MVIKLSLIVWSGVLILALLGYLAYDHRLNNNSECDCDEDDQIQAILATQLDILSRLDQLSRKLSPESKVDGPQHYPSSDPSTALCGKPLESVSASTIIDGGDGK